MSDFKSRTTNGVVTYWSVYDQEWKHARYQEQVSDREWAAADAPTRRRFERLPHEPQVQAMRELDGAAIPANFLRS